MNKATVSEVGDLKARVWIENADERSWATHRICLLKALSQHKDRVLGAKRFCKVLGHFFLRSVCLLQIDWLGGEVVQVNYFFLLDVACLPIHLLKGFQVHEAPISFLFQVLPGFGCFITLQIVRLNFLLAHVHELLWESLWWEAKIVPARNTICETKRSFWSEKGVFICLVGSFTDWVASWNDLEVIFCWVVLGFSTLAYNLCILDCLRNIFVGQRNTWLLSKTNCAH